MNTQAPWVSRLADNVARVREHIGAACQRAGRVADSVHLVAITKYVELPAIRGLLDLGVRDSGESRVQQLVLRAEALGATPSSLDSPLPADSDRPVVPRWHMVGHLQRNKVRTLLPYARILHSLDSLRLAEEVQKQAEKSDAVVDAFVEVNVAAEASKQGLPAAQLEELLIGLRAHGRIRVRGLMTMAPLVSDPETVRPHFARLRDLLHRLRNRGVAGPDCVHLSMGMTQDYAVAIEEGATFVRIGSALFEGLPADLFTPHEW